MTKPEKTKTIVVIESHEQTIIRRSRRVIISQLLTQESVDRPAPAAAGREQTKQTTMKIRAHSVHLDGRAGGHVFIYR